MNNARFNSARYKSLVRQIQRYDPSYRPQPVLRRPNQGPTNSEIRTLDRDLLRAKQAGECGEGVATRLYTDPRNLIPTERPSGSVVKRLSRDMKENGYNENYPISATRNARNRLEIQDGHHRRDAAIRAGISKVPVEVHN